MYNLLEFEQKLKRFKGKSGGYPGEIDFDFPNGGKTLRAKLGSKFNLKNFKSFDPYTLACLVECNKLTSVKISNVIFNVDHPVLDDVKIRSYFESLKRRISFLSINNVNIKFELTNRNENVKLYDKKSLFNRPSNEIIHSKASKRGDDDEPSKLEKAFQAFLYGKGLKSRTNDRLTILGEDFINMKGKEVGILREFPTGVFKDKISTKNRILPTLFIDIVTLNNSKNLSVIELKLDNYELEIISQILDYSLYFSCYRNLLMKTPNISETFNLKDMDVDIFCYIVSNKFHSRLDDILQFYSTKNKSYGFSLKKILLGEIKEI